MNQYKKIYKDNFNFDWSGKNFDIHHLDFNHNNNDYSNLLLIPKRLHQQYHALYSNLYPDLKNLEDPEGFQCGVISDRDKIFDLLELKKDMFFFSNLKFTLQICSDFFKCYTSMEDILKNTNEYLYNKYLGGGN